MKILLIIIFLFIAFLQKENITRLYNWLFDSN